MRNSSHRVDFCVVGGGMAGLCAAVAAARHGTRVALIQDRPVLGGNASSEVRMWVCGARGPDMRETGILEEIMLENLRRNPLGNWPLWDSVLYGLARYQPNLEMFLNASVLEAEMDGPRLRAVTAWQLTSETRVRVEADLFADCSGDSILAPLSGAEFRIGREARREFGEDIAPEESDLRTMGMSCLIQARETDREQEFIPPSWANRYERDQDLPLRGHKLDPNSNFWWMELGGEQDSIHDTEHLRDDLLRVAFGVWDHIKNHGDHGARNWTLEWVGFLPGKRESRRYLGDHILTQNDIRASGPFDDIVAYGGWPMDDHHPGGMRHPGKPTIFHPAPSPYGIPYRCLYSRNVENLFCAGRNISATHTGISSTRVMGTCAILGQAVGTAAAIAARAGLSPREVHQRRLRELQTLLMEDDCHLPGLTRAVPALSRDARLVASEGDPEPLRNGMDRPAAGAANAWAAPPGSWVEYRFAAPCAVEQARLVFDSNLNREKTNLPCSYPLGMPSRAMPPALTRAFRLEIQGADGAWRLAHRTGDNTQRLVRAPLSGIACAVRFIPESTWGGPAAGLFAFDVR